MKKCSKCGQWKSLDKFYKDKQKSSGTRPDCKVCVNSRCFAYQKLHREDANARNLKYKYGITKEKYLRLFKKQKGKCAICGNPQSRILLAVDHCHRTGQNRELLCINCNFGLGYFKDNINLFKKAIKYLKKWQRLLRSATSTAANRGKR